MALHRVRLDSLSGGSLSKTSNEDDEMESEKQRLDTMEVCIYTVSYTHLTLPTTPYV